MKDCNPKCDLIFRNQCTSIYGSNACKFRYFNDRCLMKLREKEKEKEKEKELKK